jgi:inositol phosphorylceramide synthase catalytic subunit
VIRRFVRHVGDLWPRGGWLLPLPFVVWCASRLALGEARWEQLALAVVMPALAYATVRTQRLFRAVLPLALLGLTYDAMRYVQNVGLSADRVHDCDLRAIESSLFGRPGWTVHDWLQAHPAAWLDRLCAVPYGTFLFVTVGFALWLYVRAGAAATQRFAWAFFAMSLAGFVTYHLYPAAPPWYFHAHGCTVDLATRASEGPNLARVDAWLDVGYFHGLYGRSNDVFGSVPSLHVAYPALILLEGWRWLRAAGRAAAIGFAAWMAFAAVYLDHHWIVDVLLGWIACGAAYSFVYVVAPRRRAPRPARVPSIDARRGCAGGACSAAQSRPG